jgi:cation diffusion facilitator family transporter
VSHHRRAVGAAILLNTVIVLVELGAGFASRSLSLLTDGVHNLSDELALVCLYLAFFLPGWLGRQSQRTANALNSVGIVAVSGILVWESVDRIRHPAPVLGLVALTVGLTSAAANAGVALLLRDPARHSASARLAYLHNRGDVVVSLIPALAGLTVAANGPPIVDSVAALAVASWLILSTLRELRATSNELLWPQEIECRHEIGTR